MQFTEFPKMARLSREVVITEKIDGTNAGVVIVDVRDPSYFQADEHILAHVDNQFAVYAQSRTRMITPADDNFGFAKWVKEHAIELALGLGPGVHFGEWWGQGIQRNYGLKEKRFSLFNVSRWGEGGKDEARKPACCHVVPVIERGDFNTVGWNMALERLKSIGSLAAPGFMKPEGIVVFHTAANSCFKKTIDKDEVPKALAKAA